jgi:hypothetical protein
MSECGVCIYADSDGESAEFQDVSIRKARKPHRCCECGYEIKPGERYEHYWGKYDGETAAIDTCIICMEIAEAFYCDGRLYGGGLWENMSHVMGELTTTCFDKLSSPEAKAELQRRWIEWKFAQARKRKPQ